MTTLEEIEERVRRYNTGTGSPRGWETCDIIESCEADIAWLLARVRELEAALEESKANTVTVSADAYDRILDAVANPREPTQAMKDLMKGVPVVGTRLVGKELDKP